MADGGEQFGVADLVVTGVVGQQDDQAFIDPLGEVVGPAAGFAEGLGGAASADDGGVVQVGVLATVKTLVIAA